MRSEVIENQTRHLVLSLMLKPRNETLLVREQINLQCAYSAAFKSHEYNNNLLQFVIVSYNDNGEVRVGLTPISSKFTLG